MDSKRAAKRTANGQQIGSKRTADWQQNDSKAVIIKEDTEQMYLAKGL
jgi:hypothetical protein